MASTIGVLIADLARTHVELWHEEDKARAPEDARVAAAKRAIDALNQRRNDLIEQIDEVVQSLLQSRPDDPGAKADPRG